ncbi:uncharacterized protein LOC9652383 [Selaginella moellendorffii]|uniref:uncharacterized protein LOC9652383 n=1 Tax=Selaginella moellendorffii TaxID=88036 RepID=UPI000D1CA37E|nr:uncharacterized protein LOC9652383 [Selaginella moellendorffii]|eukprot:XP_024526684.1 uncharacterized protein LOC9652383 [Selaginella moellendorffii]
MPLVFRIYGNESSCIPIFNPVRTMPNRSSITWRRRWRSVDETRTRVWCMAKKSKRSSSSGTKGNDAKSSPQSPSSSAYAKETRRVVFSLQNVGKVTPMGKQILKNINLGMYMGAKIGILGSNGSGKSSLLNLLAGVDKNYDGDVSVDRNLKLGYLPQEPLLDDGATVMENIEPALSETRKLLSDFEQVSADMATGTGGMEKLMSRMEKLQDALDACNGWELDRRLERALSALKCPPPDAFVANLSGGELRRVALCRLLLQSPDILLLDEPTNHLDAEAVAWLEQYLADFKGTVVAVTHDRYFLDNVAGWILELDRGQGIPFEGNYSAWLEAKEKRMSVEEKEQTALKRTIARELEWIRQKAKGQQKKGRARERSYEELLQKAKEHEKAEKLQSIYLPPGPRLGNLVVEAENLRKDLGGRTLIENLTFSLPPAGVVGVIGANGTGKSTLFRMLIGQESPDSGRLRIGETVVPLYVDQSRESLTPGRTVFQEISDGDDEVTLGERKVSARAYLSWFNFKGADQQKLVGSLSGGERNRLHLAKVLKCGGNFLLLDEPTNDLDVDTLRTLEEAIHNFAGSVIVISHDRWFLDRIATHILAFEGGSTVTYFQGSYTEYEADNKKREVGNTKIKYHAVV